MMNKRRMPSESEPATQHRATDSSRQDTEDGQSNGGRGWHGDPQGHAAAGSKGGRKVSQDREHMASIGRKGGQTVSRDRQHMAEIGRKGGQSRTDAPDAQSDGRSNSH